MKCVNPQQSSRNLLSEIRQRLRQRFIFEVKADLAVQKFKQNDNNFDIAYYRFSSHSQNEVSIDQQRRKDLTDAIEAEHVRSALFEDEHSIQAYFNKYLHADFGNPETRDTILEYLVDKIYVYDDRLVITSWYSEDNREIPFDILDCESDSGEDTGSDSRQLHSPLAFWKIPESLFSGSLCM